MPSRRRSTQSALAALALALLTLSCAAAPGPPPIALGTPCAHCGMAIGDLRFACERGQGKAWRPYDAIECLLADAGSGGSVWLTDYDHPALHAADSLWVVRGDLPSPMGGGYAAFLDPAAAAEVAAARNGRVARLSEFTATSRPAVGTP